MIKIWALLLSLTGLLIAQTAQETTVITGNNLSLQSFCGDQIVVSGQNIMAYTVVQHTAFAHPTGSAGAFGSNLTAGNTAIVGIEIGLSSSVSSVVGSNNGTYTQAGTYTDSTNSSTIYEIYYKANVASGAETVTVNGVSAANLSDLMLVEVSGLGSSPTVDVKGGNTGATAPASLSLSPTAADFIFVLSGFLGGTTGTLTNLTLLDSVNDVDYFNTTSGSGSVTMSDAGLMQWGMFGVAFSSGGGPTTKNATWKAQPQITMVQNATRIAEAAWSSNPKATLTQAATRVAETSMTIQPKATLTMQEIVTAQKTITINPNITLAMQPLTIHQATITFTPRIVLVLNASNTGAKFSQLLSNMQVRLWPHAGG